MDPDQLIVGYQSATAAIRARVVEYARRLWSGSPSLRDEDVERIIARLVPAVQSGQRQVAQLTDAYIARVAAFAGVEWSAGLDLEAIVNYRGVPAVEVYRRPAVTAYTALGKGVPYSQAVQQGLSRLMSITSTDMQQAKNRAAAAGIGRSGFEFFRRVLTGSENCALCAIASTQRYRRGDLLPIHPGCVPGDSVLSPVAGGSAHLADFAWGEVEAVSRRLFQGELIEFVTARGDQVRVTPNHPVLTDQGWLPAHLLSEGDAVFRGGSRERVVGSGPDVHQRPAFAEDVFDAARVSFPLVRMPLASEDFHADAADGEVEIVYTHGNFPTPRGSDLGERFGESGLVHAHGGGIAFDGGGALGALLPRGLATSRGGMSGGDLSGDLFGGHAGGPIESGLLTPARFDAPAGEFTPESAAVYASQGVNLKRRLAGLVEGDSIVELRRVGWSGHVFNLHTREGWYSSNNHIVSNCDCGVAALFAPSDPGQVIDSPTLELIHDEVKRVTGSVDRGGRAPDYRDLVVTNMHGELGPTLGWRGEQFTGPADIGRAAVL